MLEIRNYPHDPLPLYGPHRQDTVNRSSESAHLAAASVCGTALDLKDSQHRESVTIASKGLPESKLPKLNRLNRRGSTD